mmetsp:Transcript_45449/g.106207  ORF Transcript_45449/g.106207 Transcript_45449/m.106207 type:complete len:438 (+) Transcript_45449:92-1405(+)
MTLTPGRSGRHRVGGEVPGPGEERRTAARPEPGRAGRGHGSDAPPPKRRKAEEDSCFREAAGPSRIFIAAQTATVEWTIKDFLTKRSQGEGQCLDGPCFGPRRSWQVFCHPDGRCYNLPQGGPCGVFIRYLGPHERVPAYATIEKKAGGAFRVPENNTRESPFVVVFGRCEIEEWGVCKDFGLFDEDFCADLVDEALVLRARVTWIEPRPDSLLPQEVMHLQPGQLSKGNDSLSSDLASLWAARRGGASAGSTGGPISSMRQLPPSDLVLIAEGQRFEADRVLLAARSNYFAGMLSFREASQREVTVPVPPRALAAVLRFAYTDEAPELRSSEEAIELLEASSQLNFPGLQRQCSDYLRDSWLSLDTALQLLRVADQHGASSLRSEALSVIASHFDALKTTPAWEDLLQNGMNPMLIQDLLQAVQAAATAAGRASRG